MSRAEQSRAEHYSIDFTKFIFAFFVVAIHTKPFINADDVRFLSFYNTLVGLAVPFFFIASGYLITENQRIIKQNTLTKRVNRHLVKLVKYYMIWSFIYLPLAIYGYHVNGDNAIRAVILYVRNLFLQGEHYFSWPLWYLLSSIYAFLVLYFLLKKKIVSTSALVGIIIFFIFLANVTNILVADMHSLSGIVAFAAKVLQKTVGTGRIFTGVYFVLVGVLIARYKEYLSGINSVILVSTFVVCFVVVALFATPLVGIVMHGIFFVIIEKATWKRNNGVYLRRCSTVIYYIHMLFVFVYTLCVGMEFRYGVSGFVMTSICAMMVAVLVNLKKVRNCKLVIMLFGKM